MYTQTDKDTHKHRNRDLRADTQAYIKTDSQPHTQVDTDKVANRDTHIDTERRHSGADIQTDTHIDREDRIKFGHSSSYLCKTRAIFFALALFRGERSLL